MADIKDRAREYLAKHSEYSEVFRQTFVAVDTLTAMVEFAEQETKDLEETINGLREQLALRYDLEDKIVELNTQIEKMKSDVISERDHSLKIEDIITCTVLNGILKKWEIKENG